MDRRSFLVTGGAGFIGSHFCELLANKGHSLVVLDALTYAGHQINLKSLEKKSGYHFVRGNIADPVVLKELFKEFSFDAVFNFAAESHVDRSIEGPAEFIETNIIGTYQLLSQSLEHFKNSNKKDFCFVQISTDEVFGSLGDDGLFTEETAYQPNSPYSASKASADHLVRAWHHTFGLPTITTHCSNNYGPRQYPEKLIPFMIACALQDKPMGVYGNGKNVRDWIYVKDHCEGIYRAYLEGRRGEHYCFGGNAEKSNLEVVHEICRILDELAPRKDGQSFKSQVQFVKDRLGHDWRYAIDDSKANKHLGSYRKMEFSSGLHETVKWYLDNQAWVKTILDAKEKTEA